ncbi:MAG: peptide chain release factor 2 [Rickettsiales bacterium]|jgi:peptide chain release factor 2
MEITDIIKEIEEYFKVITNFFDLGEAKKDLKELEKITLEENFWNKEDANKIMKKKTEISDKVSDFEGLKQEFSDNKELFDMSQEENDSESLKEVEKSLIELSSKLSKLKIEYLFSGENDSSDCFLEINTGVGGNDAADFSEMLLRMYLRWAESHNFKANIVSYLDGEEAGIKSACIKISGKNAFGWCRAEAGVHRLVRISPFNSVGKRQTSFSSVWVYPVADEKIEIEIDDKDLRIDTYRASGAGGQHVNKTDSAVRITHLPTNIVVQCQNDRSQLKNRAEAMKMLKSRLFELEMRKKQEEKDRVNSGKTDNGWGHQIRSYVMHPYQMVKDIRTGYEIKNYQRVLDGELDGFIEAFLLLP